MSHNILEFLPEINKRHLEAAKKILDTLYLQEVKLKLDDNKQKVYLLVILSLIYKFVNDWTDPSIPLIPRKIMNKLKKEYCVDTKIIYHIECVVLHKIHYRLDCFL